MGTATDLIGHPADPGRSLGVRWGGLGLPEN